MLHCSNSLPSHVPHTRARCLHKPCRMVLTGSWSNSLWIQVLWQPESYLSYLVFIITDHIQRLLSLLCCCSWKVLVISVMSDSLWPHGLHLWNSGSCVQGIQFLLQGIFPTQGSNWGLLHGRQILYHLSHQGIPYCCFCLVLFVRAETVVFFSAGLVVWFGVVLSSWDVDSDLPSFLLHLCFWPWWVLSFI